MGFFAVRYSFVGSNTLWNTCVFVIINMETTYYNSVNCLMNDDA